MAPRNESPNSLLKPDISSVFNSGPYLATAITPAPTFSAIVATSELETLESISTINK